MKTMRGLEGIKLTIMDRMADDDDLSIQWASPVFSETGFTLLTTGTSDGHARLETAIQQAGCVATLERESGYHRQWFVQAADVAHA